MYNRVGPSELAVRNQQETIDNAAISPRKGRRPQTQENIGGRRGRRNLQYRNVMQLQGMKNLQTTSGKPITSDGGYSSSLGDQ